jgi:hypothetical protein
LNATGAWLRCAWDRESTPASIANQLDRSGRAATECHAESLHPVQRASGRAAAITVCGIVATSLPGRVSHLRPSRLASSRSWGIITPKQSSITKSNAGFGTPCSRKSSSVSPL